MSRIAWCPHVTYDSPLCPNTWMEFYPMHRSFHTHGYRHCLVCVKHPEHPG